MKGIIIFLAAILVVNCKPKHTEAETKNYLKKFGFIDEHKYGGGSLAEGIKLYQRTFNLLETGVVDKETEALIDTDRCGVKDINSEIGQVADFGKWEKESLSYSIKSYTQDLTRKEVKQLTARALKIWSKVTNLKFSRQRKGGDIIFEFVTRSHGDNYPFEGPGGVLAHAFYPSSGDKRGQVHYDDDETFTTNKATGTNYLWVATHELGHTLGLEHDTNNMNAVMYPYYRSFDYHKGEVKLHDNDRFRIQQIYGSRTKIPKKSSPPKRKVPSRPPVPREVCRDRVSYCSEPRYLEQCNSSSFMLQYCVRTCGFCIPNEKGCFKGCQDQNSGCGNHLDKCRNYNKAWTDWQKGNCALACGYCCKA